MTKKTNKHRKSAQDFSNNPFKELKGLSALETENREPPSARTDRQDPAAIKSGNDESPISFADEMASMGVRRIEDGELDDVASTARSGQRTSSLTENKGDACDLTTFLDAIGSMEKVFKEEWSPDSPDKRAVPRRMKQLERGQLKPEAELDLHGMTTDEAAAKVLFFLQDAIFQGLSTVLLITGKGLHSEGGPVLRSAIESLLSKKNEQVVEWSVAPRRYGGAGALVVFLRQTGQKNT